MADLEGISYLRTLRPNTPVLYGPDEEFPIGGSRVLREGDDVTIVGGGITVHEALKAADALAGEGVGARDRLLLDQADRRRRRSRPPRARRGRLVTVEDHWPEGGLGEAVLAALAEQGASAEVTHLAVREMPRSGKPDELLAAFGIDADAIVEAARKPLA